MQGENIICFSKDYFEDPTSNHHVLRHLARRNRVLWLNSISTRTPTFTSGRDLGKIVSKVGAFAGGPRNVGDDLWVYTPLVLPFPHSPAARAINRQILRITLGLLRRRLGMESFQLWTFLPNVADYVGNLGESLVVYYCVDEWSKFSYVDEQATAAAEKDLCSRADVVFAVCHGLAERKRALNPATHVATHGVDHELFAGSLSDVSPLPADLARLPQPVLGFYGTLQDWVDFDLITYLAERHPDWSIALIGKPLVDTRRLSRFPNVHLLGRKPHAELPAYCRGFAVGLIPYVISERMQFVNPIKLREYLSAGLPVVSTAFPEVTHYRELCTVAADYAAFEQGVVEALRSDGPGRRQRRSEAMRSETWEKKMVEVEARVMEAKARKVGEGFSRTALPPDPASRGGQITPSPLRQLLRRGMTGVLPRRLFMVNGPPEDRMVCLTFDDGPHPENTPRVLDVLRAHHVQATFFVVGERAARHPDLARRMVSEGHVVADHSFTHGDPERTSSAQLAAEVRRSRDLLAGLLGRSPELYRPPHGKVTAAKLVRLWRERQTIVLWNVDPKDYARASTEEIREWFASHPVGPGDIVLLHDTQAHTAGALPDLIAAARRDGLSFTTVDRWRAR